MIVNEHGRCRSASLSCALFPHPRNQDPRRPDVLRDAGETAVEQAHDAGGGEEYALVACFSPITYGTPFRAHLRNRRHGRTPRSQLYASLVSGLPVRIGYFAGALGSL